MGGYIAEGKPEELAESKDAYLQKFLGVSLIWLCEQNS